MKISRNTIRHRLYKIPFPSDKMKQIIVCTELCVEFSTQNLLVSLSINYRTNE